MDKFVFLRIEDEDGFVVVNHVGNDNYDTVFIDPSVKDIPEYEWRKAFELATWVEKERPNWKLIYKSINYDQLIPL